MASYVFMKILESQPHRYDRGISWLSLGQADRWKRRIVDQLVKPESRVLDIGCGTGTLAILAAQRGASVTAFDASEAMLEVAKQRVVALNLGDSIQLQQMGIAGMDAFADATFDSVISTLVFSELSRDERAYALHHAHRVLKPGGRLVIADEVRPTSRARRFIYRMIRIPLVIITFLVTQTTTRPVTGLEKLVSEAGFRPLFTERNRWQSFLYLVAVKEEP